jgi:hypothetical protein
MERKIVAHMKNGRLFKGTTGDFHPSNPSFAVKVEEGPWKDQAVTLEISKMKALVFVTSLEGNRDYREKKMARPESKVGKKVTVNFHDGESIRGTATGLNLKLPGFYLFPADPKSNNKRIFIVRDALRNIRQDK